jgi:quercetin dioxygenase-like cupin family protein
VGEIFQVNERDRPWIEYQEALGADGSAQIRVKALTMDEPEIPPVQFVEYAPRHTDPMHSHRTDEFFIVTEGSVWLDDVESGAGSVVFVPRNTEYAVRAGDEGARFFRVVFPG